MEVIKIQGISEEIYYTVSKDGLPIYIWNNPYAKSFYLSLNVRYGSLDTEFMVKGKKYQVPDGIAHFMEHVKFNVKKGVTANDLFDPLGSEINAFTTFQYTSYLVYGTSKLEENINNLLDFVYNPYFTKDMIQKEKGIIASEINMGKDQPYNELYFEFNKCIYVNEKFRNLISGEVSDVKNTKVEDLKLIYDTFYHPKNMFLVVSGNVNAYEVEQIVNKNLSNKKFIKYQEPIIIYPKEPKNVCQKYKEISANVEVSKAKIGIKIPRKDFSFDDVKLSVILQIILNSNFGDTSDLKEDLLQNGLITYLYASRTIYRDYVVIDVMIESKYMEEAILRVKNALKDLKMNEEDLSRKVNSAIATLVTNYENAEEVSNMLQNYLVLYGKVISNMKEIYEAITMQDIKQVISKINTKEMAIVKMEKNAK